MKNHPPFLHRRRPSWWPENEEWPPRRWRAMRGRSFFRRMGCMFIGFFFFAFVGLVTILGLLINSSLGIQFGPPQLQQPGLLFPLGFAGTLILVFTVLWGVRSLRRMSIPLDEMLDASTRVAEGDFTVRLGVKGPPEVRALMREFNSMAERLELNDRQRRNMLADISHELRSPITIMQGNLEGMIDGVYTPTEARLKSLYDETKLLSRLVDDLRTLALAESGSLNLKRESTDLGILIREVVSAFKTQADGREVMLSLEIADVAPANVDTTRIREVLMNLLSNAIRYTPDHGEIKVGVTGSGLGGNGTVTVFVKNTGEGIPQADLGRIFDRFYKSSDSGGMGLGLSIAKYLVEAHGGRIRAESETGQGTGIFFTLPVSSTVHP